MPAAQLGSFAHPLVIMLTVPSGVLGALAGPWASGGTLNLFSQIGIVMLVGLAAKNGILIGESAHPLARSGPRCARGQRRIGQRAPAADPDDLHPTSIATVVGASHPALVLAGGPGSAHRATIGVVVISGVSSSTLLSRFVAPAFYAVSALYTRLPEAGARKSEMAEAATPVGGGKNA